MQYRRRDNLNRIINILKEINPYIAINNYTDLLEEGILDSVGIMYLITSLEELYDIEISGDNIIPNNFRNIIAIHNLVESLNK